MSRATVGWQQTVGELGLGAAEADYLVLPDAILAALDAKTV